MLVVPGLPSYNGAEVYYLKGVIGLPIVISFRDRWYTHIFFFLEMGSLMTSSSSAGPIQISKFPEPCVQLNVFLTCVWKQVLTPWKYHLGEMILDMTLSFSGEIPKQYCIIFFHKNISFRYSLEVPWQGGKVLLFSIHNMFSWRNNLKVFTW